MAAEPTENATKLPSLMQNWVSLGGAVLSSCTLFGAVALLGVDFMRGMHNPYQGIITYVVAPGFLLLGLALVLIGVLLERRRRRNAKPGAIPPFPRIDFNVPRHRNTFVLVSGGVFMLLVLSAIGSYRAYEFTESVMFCGDTCHEVMSPEKTAYAESPHARVTCVQCHIGPGAEWFVKSKISGLYQVYSVLTNKYSRPIPVPVENLRPAQETCEQCHWPRKFFGAVLREGHHYLADETNSPWTIQMALKVGGGDPTFGPAGGIHWHMNIENKIEYVARDAQRQVIPWVRITDPNGKVRVYESASGKLTKEELDKEAPRVMDCIDCHNRPSHRYNPPVDSMNMALFTGRVSTKIPFIKQQALTVLSKEYATREEANAAIAQGLGDYYKTEQADFAKTNRGLVEAAITEVQRIYAQNFFPEMKVNWKPYPDNIGHMNFPGCFRCHDGEHKSDDGSVITKDCKACHVIIGQGAQPTAASQSLQGLDFEHPSDIGDLWMDQNCSECHDGTTGGL